ncbi:unnamed protein product [Camellia sinensis]
MEKKPNSNIQLPPGFRFHPTDEELIVHYLRNKATSSSLPAAIIAEVDLYKCNPWELSRKALFGEKEWYSFIPRDRKYPNGVRPNRMEASGYWKATGTDKPICSSCRARIIGVKKALVLLYRTPSKRNQDGLKHARVQIARSNDVDFQAKRMHEAAVVAVVAMGVVKVMVAAVVQCHCWMIGFSAEFGRKTVQGTVWKINLVLEMNHFVKNHALRVQMPNLKWSENFCTEIARFSINGQKRKQPTEGTQYENFIQPKKKVTDRDDQWSDNRIELNLFITNQSEEE